MSEFLTVREAATLLRVHEKRIQALARTGKIPAVRHGRKWLFRRADLVRPVVPAQPSGQAGGVAPSLTDADEGIHLSARNRLRGRITELRIDGVMAEVRLAVGDEELVAVITASSARRLDLRVGDDVLAVVKATEVMVAKAQ